MLRSESSLNRLSIARQVPCQPSQSETRHGIAPDCTDFAPRTDDAR
ncbi:hypothetical protein C7S16_7170 [Burkholderia thailandensis]|uniref:Uncharacterized protein n=1 Tax=Burkholderia thailandensis TaxID=57975 RepID=A0AAW9CQF9_BURTH|nr:hypothetical protein [Burkholderia thailandensis]MDW9252667.1 hypothetical protein [Burkholderia thailandensis]